MLNLYKKLDSKESMNSGNSAPGWIMDNLSLIAKELVV